MLPVSTPSSVSMDSVVVGQSARMRAVFEFLRVIGSSESTDSRGTGAPDMARGDQRRRNSGSIGCSAIRGMAEL